MIREVHVFSCLSLCFTEHAFFRVGPGFGVVFLLFSKESHGTHYVIRRTNAVIRSNCGLTTGERKLFHGFTHRETPPFRCLTICETSLSHGVTTIKTPVVHRLTTRQAGLTRRLLTYETKLCCCLTNRATPSYRYLTTHETPLSHYPITREKPQS